MRVLQGYEAALYDVDWRPDGPSSSPGRGSQLASAGSDTLVAIWEVTDKGGGTLRRDRLYERLTITGIKGLTEAQKASLRALGAFEDTRVGK